MLKLQDIVKEYQSGDTIVHALKGINLEFREHEFVSILGQSGCGKTTMLNIIGGLDRYTSGDLTIDGISTKKYKDKDWDAYRNHKIGFVFQNYNLIPHQTVLSNVELALTLSGVSKTERRRRAIDVLNQVGLGDQINKKPNQMSGGQMQRVAIARALINNPEILLADEPTGALDSETSVQIMEILKDISKDKLIIMVTHNPELATQYSSRIIRLLDGKVIDDSNPFNASESVSKNEGKDAKSSTEKTNLKKEKGKKLKTSMSMLTALSLSLNNLMTKKARTFMTAFAGSIGIIGIALILSLSSGMQNYIDKVEQDTLSSYPLTIEKSTIDYSIFFTASEKKDDGTIYEPNRIYSNNMMTSMMDSMLTSISVNDLKEFKSFLDNPENGVKELTNDIQYGYDVDMMVYKKDTENGIFQVNPSTVMAELYGSEEMGSQISSMMQTDVWTEMLDNDKLIASQYDVVTGRMPQNYDEVVIVVNEDNTISEYSLYALGILDLTEFKKMFSQMQMGEVPENTLSNEQVSFSYDDLLSQSYKLVINTDIYTEENGIWTDRSSDNEYMKNLIQNSIELKVVGIIRPNKDAASTSINGTIAYTNELTKYVIDKINESTIVKQQIANPELNVFTGNAFTDTTYENNLTTLGAADLSNPASINIYARDFESKEKLADIIDKYNDDMEAAGYDDKVIQYTDYVGLMMSSVSDVINAISYVLIAFVAISLVVSSIMIGIITYISVLERTKEIGILRSIGASKRDISHVFNAETLIVGFVAGALGIIITLLLNIPINIIIESITGISGVASLPAGGAVILVIISMLLTFIAGLIPSRVAAKKDPVIALRSE